MSIERSIFFNAEKHKYTDDLNNVYTSVTTLIDKYKKPFDKMFWAEYKAKERGVSVNVILKEWETITTVACDRGNERHDYLETSVNTSNGYKYIFNNTDTDTIYSINSLLKQPTFGLVNPELLLTTGLKDRFPEIYDLILTYVKLGYRIYSEVCTYWYDYLVSGKIDLLLIKDNHFVIIDWKTNKGDIKFESGYYKKIRGVVTNQWIKTNDKLLNPISNLANCKGINYSLQLSLYARLNEYWGLICKDLILVHIKPEHTPTNIIDKVKILPITYMKRDIDLILSDHKKRINQTRNIQYSLFEDSICVTPNTKRVISFNNYNK